VSDPPATHIDQVLRRQLAHLLVLDSDEGRRQTVKTPVDENVWDTFFPDAAKTLRRPLRRSYDQGIHAASQQALDLVPFERRIFL
jgi:hypothetical protein